MRSRMLWIFAVIAAAGLGMAACTGGNGGASPGSGSVGSSAGSGGGPSPGGGSLQTSAMYGLTKLTKAKLCGLLSSAQAAQILGAPTSQPVFANRLGLGITCEWMHGDGNDELYVGISTILDWHAAQGIDKLLRTTPATIDGRPALLAGKQHGNDWTQIDVALGGDHDPAVEYRAPTLAIAAALANAVTPRLLALAPSS